MEAPSRLLFDEPSGRRTGLVFIALSVVCFVGYVYFAILQDGPHLLLPMGVAIGLSGVAESMPTDRRRLAAGLRLLAIGIAVGVLVVLAVRPGLVMG